MLDTEEGPKWPVVKSLPMGWSHSVYVCQQLHLSLLTNFDKSKQISCEITNFRIADFRFGAYVDDYFSLGNCEVTAKRHLDMVVYEAERTGTPAKPSKIVSPQQHMKSAHGTSILGVTLHRNGKAYPHPEKM